jgi:hypothetical protein
MTSYGRTQDIGFGATKIASMTPSRQHFGLPFGSAIRAPNKVKKAFDFGAPAL